MNDPLLAEVYRIVEDPGHNHDWALAASAMELSPRAPRNRRHWAAYSVDWDGHVVSFAELNR